MISVGGWGYAWYLEQGTTNPLFVEFKMSYLDQINVKKVVGVE